jgi:hypothetical protein
VVAVPFKQPTANRYAFGLVVNPVAPLVCDVPLAYVTVSLSPAAVDAVISCTIARPTELALSVTVTVPPAPTDAIPDDE